MMVAEKEHSGQHASLILLDSSCLFDDNERQLACSLVSKVYIPLGLPWAQVTDNWVCNFGLHLSLQASPVIDTPEDDN